MSSETSKQLFSLGAAEQVALVAAGEVSCVELLEAHFARIEALNPEINAITTVLYDSARKAAKELDRATERGPLHGLPFTVKGDIDCLGTPTSRGVPALRDALPFADAPIVARLKAAGAIPIGRTNLAEMGLRLCTDNPLHGRTRNPHERKLTAGGSSGGDAAAVATGMTPLGLGGDLGGSLRVPAACCGCIALKPTLGRVPHASSIPPRDFGLGTQLMLSVGPLVRSVGDLDLLLPLISGRDLRDPRSVDAPLRGPRPPEQSAAIVTALPGRALPPSAVDAVRRAGAALEAAGFCVEEALPPDLPRVIELFTNLLASEVSGFVEQLAPFVSEALLGHLRALAGMTRGRALSSATLHVERFRLVREWSQFFDQYPVVVGPNLGVPIWPIDADLDPKHGLALIGDAVRFSMPGNILGFPSLALPMGPRDGLPTSVLVYADLWREDLCVEAALTIEQREARRSHSDDSDSRK